MAPAQRQAPARIAPRLALNLSRITSGGTFIPEIDGLRFVAIAAVVAFHIYEYLRARGGIPQLGMAGTAVFNGQRGVPLFFVISGFILGRPFAMHYICGAPRPKLKEYFLRRLTRLEPPYLITILGLFLGLAAFSTWRGLGHLLASILYSHNLIYGTPNPFFGLAWSLEIEVQFYCLIPALALIYTLPRVWRRGILLAFLLAGLLHLLPLSARFHLSLLGWIQCFAAGLLLADLHTDCFNQRKHWGFDLLSIALWPAVFLLNDPLAVILTPALALLLYLAAFRSFMFRRIFTARSIVTTGGMCYTIYLVHYPAISIVGKLVKNPTAMAIISLAVIAAFSLLFFVLIERPCMDKEWPLRLFSYFPKQKITAE